jgi:hypothetical protein
MRPIDDEVLDEIASLPRHDASAAVVSRIRRAALAELAASATGGRSREPARARGLWTRYVEPVLVVGSVVGYLTWTASTLTALHDAGTAAIEIGERGRLRSP